MLNANKYQVNTVECKKKVTSGKSNVGPSRIEEIGGWKKGGRWESKSEYSIINQLCLQNRESHMYICSQSHKQ